MTTSLNRSEAVREYFTESPIPVKPDKPDYAANETAVQIGLGLLVAGIILWYYQASLIAILLVIFGVLSFLGGIEKTDLKNNYEAAYKQYEEDCAKVESKPTDQQMDYWLNADIEKIKAEALRRLDLEDEDCRAHPYLIGGPAFLGETRFAIGKDGKVRYSNFNILVVFLTEYHVATYQCDCSLEYGQILTDRTQEFPYREITNLGTQVIKHNIRLFNETVESEKGMQEFTLETSGSNVIKVAYRFARNADSQGELTKIGGESTITAIRKKLQDYKQKYEKYEN